MSRAGLDLWDRTDGERGLMVEQGRESRGAIPRRSRSLEAELDAHRQALEACRRCEHHGDVRPVVSLARRPRVMLVGQAPGQVEVAGRPPFSGRAGRTLFKWLEEAGIGEAEARERILISAITRCYPGPAPSGRGDRVPTRSEREQCADWLAAELRIVRPALIIPVGRLAIERFLGARPLDVTVGREHVVQHEGGESVAIPLPHPSGASSWIHQPGHAELLRKSLALIGHRLEAIASSGRGRPAHARTGKPHRAGMPQAAEPARSIA